MRESIHNAWLRTIEDGVHTADIYTEGVSAARVGTQEFAAAVIERLGQEPRTLTPVRYAAGTQAVEPAQPAYSRPAPAVKELVGVDVFLHWSGANPEELAEKLSLAGTAQLPLNMITNRGVKVWPNGLPETFCTDHWRCRFHALPDAPVNPVNILALLAQVHALGFDFIKVEHLYTFDGQPGYSLGQGQ